MRRSLVTQVLLVLGVLVALAGALLGTLVAQETQRRTEAARLSEVGDQLRSAVLAVSDRHGRSMRRARDALLETRPEARIAMLSFSAEHYQEEMTRLLHDGAERLAAAVPPAPDGRFERDRSALAAELQRASEEVPAIAVALQALLDAANVEDAEAMVAAQQELTRADRAMTQILGEQSRGVEHLSKGQIESLLRRGSGGVGILTALLLLWTLVGGGWLLASVRRLRRLFTTGTSDRVETQEEAAVARELERLRGELAAAQNQGSERQRELEQRQSAVRRAERELALLRIYNDNLVNSLSASVLVTDVELNLTSSNQAARRLLGLTDADIGKALLATPLGAALSRRDPHLAESLRGALSERRLSRSEGLPFGPAGELLLDATIVPYLDESGAARGLLLVVDDVTERVHTKNQLLAAEHLAAIGRVSAQVAHEIRNPLSAIGLNAELLAEEVQSLPPARRPEAQTLVRAIAGEIERLTHITEGYLRLARLPRPNRREVDLNEVVVDLLTMLRAELAEHGVEVRLELGSPPPHAFADAGQIRQALLNVVKNSREAMDRGGVLTVRTSQGEAVASIAVADTGAGMPPEVARRVFEPFFSTKPAGTGLGLSLTQQIIQEHQGTIHVEAGAPSGTTVVVTLPRHGREDALVDDGAGASA